jgi:bifunctional non-homologous end joining protein LigD
MPGILQQLKKLEVKESPFTNKVLDTKGAVMHWIRPQLVANFEFAAWTKTGRIRKPATFLGFRKDKKAKDVVREVPKPVQVIEEEQEQNETTHKPAAKKKTGTPKKLTTSKDSNWKILEKSAPEEMDEITIGECEVQLSDVDRNVWKNIPKAALIQYYHSVAKYILPHLKDRPQSLHVKPNGAGAPGFYVKDMEGRQPECASVFTDKRRHPKPGKRDTIDYLVCNNEATLLYMVNLSCIDINPWMSRTIHPTQPDFFNIDLDPSDADFNKVIEVALAAKEVLNKLKLQSLPKTSGKTGMHIYIPVTGITYEQGRNYSEQLGAQIHAIVKNISTLNISLSSRKNKVFIDPSQNDYADTLAAAYSVRPNHKPTVSTPLEWKEI